MTTSRLRFSVVIPVRNGGELLRHCVESVLAQTYENFDVLILDNASTDGSVDEVEKLGDPRLKVSRVSTPLSITENWARIADEPRSELMTILGADDVLDASFLEIMGGLIRSAPESPLFHAHFRLIDETGLVIRSCRAIPASEDASEFLRARLRRERDSFGTGYVMRSAHYDAVGGIPRFPGLLFADDALWLTLMGRGRKATASEECFSYRLHGGSASGSAGGVHLLGALGEYVRALDQLVAGDERLAAVTHSYLPGFLQREMQSWYVGQLMEASRQGRRGISVGEARSVLRSLHPRLERELIVLRRHDRVLRAHEIVNAVAPLRALYRRRKEDHHARRGQPSTARRELPQSPEK